MEEFIFPASKLIVEARNGSGKIQTQVRMNKSNFQSCVDFANKAQRIVCFTFQYFTGNGELMA